MPDSNTNDERDAQTDPDTSIGTYDIPGGEDINADTADLQPRTRRLTGKTLPSDVPSTSRRRFMQLVGASVGTAATAGVTSAADDTTTTTTTTSSDEGNQTSDGVSDKHWMEQDPKDYVAQDTGAQPLVRIPSQKEVARMMTFSTLVTRFGALGAVAAGAAKSVQWAGDMAGIATAPIDKVFNVGRDFVGEIYFGPFSPDKSRADDDLRAMFWYEILQAEQQFYGDIAGWLESFEEKEHEVLAALQTETRAAFNNGESYDAAIQRCKQAMRDKYSIPEANLYMLAEEMMIRFEGIYYQAAAAMSTTTGIRDQLEFNSTLMLRPDYINGFLKPDLKRAEVRLMDGRILNTSALQLSYDLNLDAAPDDAPHGLVVHPLASETNQRDRWVYFPSDQRMDSLHVGDETDLVYSPPQSVDASEYMLFNYSGDFSARIDELHQKLWDRVQSWDNTIETFVKDAYNHFAGQDKIPMSWLDTSAVMTEMGLDWQDTKSSGFATLFAAMRGYSTNSQFQMDIEHLTGDEKPGEGETYKDAFFLFLGDWVPYDSNAEYTLQRPDDSDIPSAYVEDTKLFVPGPPLEADHVLKLSDGTTVERAYGELELYGQWTSQGGGDAVGFKFDMGDTYAMDEIDALVAKQAPAFHSGTTYTVPADTSKYPDAEAKVATEGGGLVNIPRGDRFILSNITGAEGESMSKLPIRLNDDVEFSVQGAEELMNRQTWIMSRHGTMTDPDPPTTTPQPPHPPTDPVEDNTLLYIGGAALAGLLAALGIKGGDS